MRLVYKSTGVEAKIGDLHQLNNRPASVELVGWEEPKNIIAVGSVHLKFQDGKTLEYKPCIIGAWFVD